MFLRESGIGIDLVSFLPFARAKLICSEAAALCPFYVAKLGSGTALIRVWPATQSDELHRI